MSSVLTCAFSEILYKSELPVLYFLKKAPTIEPARSRSDARAGRNFLKLRGVLAGFSHARGPAAGKKPVFEVCSRWRRTGGFMFRYLCTAAHFVFRKNRALCRYLSPRRRAMHRTIERNIGFDAGRRRRSRSGAPAERKDLSDSIPARDGSTQNKDRRRVRTDAWKEKPGNVKN